MKKNILIALGVLTAFFAQSQVETPSIPRADSPLIVLAKNAAGNERIDFNTISLTNYPNTIDFDFSRMTTHEMIKAFLDGSGAAIQTLPTSVLDIDGQTFIVEGKVTFVSVKHYNLSVGSESFSGANSVEMLEEYTIASQAGIAATYTNTYYSFFDETTLVFEAFHKVKEFLPGLVELYDGVSYTISDVAPPASISLVLNPNPATGQTDASFTLPVSGYVTLTITDLTGTINRIVFSGTLPSGSNLIRIPLTNFKTETYNVKVNYQGAIYSTNLIVH